MKKAHTLFLRDNRTHKVVDELNLAAAWVLDPAEDIVVRRKHDGLCVRFNELGWWLRCEVRLDDPYPELFDLDELDPNTQIEHGWRPLELGDPMYDNWMEANRELMFGDDIVKYGTYELCGPNIYNNPEGLNAHKLIFHDGAEQFPITSADIDYVGLYKFLKMLNAFEYVEGIIFTGKSGQRAKLEFKDYSNEI